MNNTDIFVVSIVAAFYAATICIPKDFYLSLAKKLDRNQQGGNRDNKPDKISRKPSDETFFLRNHLRRVSQGANDGEIKKMLDEIIPDISPYKKQKYGK